MAYPINTGTILKAAGYKPLIDFISQRSGSEIIITEWNHADPQPTDQQVIDWGNDTTPLPDSRTFTEATTVPAEVTNYQLRQALNTNPADRAAVEALVDASTDQNVKDGWAHALQFKADNPLFQGAIANLGWTQETVNNYLKLAATFK